MGFSSFSARLLSSTALTRRWAEDPLKLAGDLFLTGNSILLLRGGVGLNMFDVASSMLFFTAASLYTFYGNHPVATRAALLSAAVAMGALWTGAEDGKTTAVEQAGFGLYIFSQIFGAKVRGYAPDSKPGRPAALKAADAVFSRPLRTTGILAAISKLPMIYGSVDKIYHNNDRANSAAFLLIAGLWLAADIATLCAGQIRNRVDQARSR